jgi:hypothetical protein
LLSLKRAQSQQQLKKLPVEVLQNVFSFLLGQDFVPVPQQNIATDMEIDDADQLVLEKSQAELMEITKHLNAIDQYIPVLKKALAALPAGALLDKQVYPLSEAEAKAKQEQLYATRSSTELEVGKIRQAASARQRDARAVAAKEAASRARKAERRRHSMASAAVPHGMHEDLSIGGGSGGGGGGGVSFDPLVEGLGELSEEAHGIGGGGGGGRGGGGGNDRGRGGGRRASAGGGDGDDDDGEIRFLDDSDDDSLLGDEEEDKLDDADDDEEEDMPTEALNDGAQSQVRAGLLKYLARKPMTRTELLKKLKPMLTLDALRTKTQEILAQSFITRFLNEECEIIEFLNIPKYQLKPTDAEKAATDKEQAMSRWAGQGEGGSNYLLNLLEDTAMDASAAMDGLEVDGGIPAVVNLAL